MKTRIFKSFVELTGSPVSSALLKKLTTSRISKPLIKPFASFYHIQVDEAEYRIEQYSSLNDFFTRSLQAGKRPIDSNPMNLISPVDGVLSDSGNIDPHQQFSVKDKTYSLHALLGDSEKAERYTNGYYYLFYLSPRHYHHFHYPISGTLVNRYALGSTSYPVNDLGIRMRDNVFSSNHRVISELSTDFGHIAIVKVGALNVNSIRIANSETTCVKGQNFGHFAFGSTVILFIEHHEAFRPEEMPFTEVQVGDRIGEWQY
ncbi:MULTISPECIES: archaetidylserine decarboxylase [unclassified Sporosarcina]|uniref:archaetidylserine decarboxylase n=1 Tax=unclassified Sporosarcina TaxID=2647733 RepID=UPI000C16D4F7|nr:MULTISPECIES: archaetidylserine decarboxylase [unclassified Sporosarcina]PIC71306.1 phosphatidylserine decarboxylase [Sporosarcina sp. P16b]PID25004.1 phosphatidylserine decarboxylase [Sporosarcina sp. P7]